MMSAVVILALVGYASAGVIGYSAPLGLLTSGASTQFRSQDNIGNYAFGYNEDHSSGGTFRREQGGPGHQVGSYGLRDADGRVRVVNYVADAGGFRANIQTNEPGVEPKDPANVLINKAEAVVAAPAVLAAPLLAAPAYSHAHLAAPLAYHGGQVASYSTVTQHVAPSVHYAAAPLLAAPVSYATKTIHHAAPLAHYNLGW